MIIFNSIARPHFKRFLTHCVMLSLFAAACPCTLAMAQQSEDRPEVIAAHARLSTWYDPLEALGTLRADESIVLSATVTETISELDFEDGERVKAGQPLVYLDDREEQARLRSAQALLIQRRNALDRARQLESRNLGARADREDALAQLRQTEADIEALEAQLSNYTLRAPFDGVVGLRNLSIGTLVSPGTELLTLDKLDVMKLDFTVPGLFLSVLHPGLKLSATTPSYPERHFYGEISSIDTRIDTVSRSVKVRAMLPNSLYELRPGMLMQVILERRPRQALVVPESVLIPNGERQYVMFIDDDNDNRIEQREVEIGERRAGEVEILGGLSEGDLVVSQGLLKVREGDNVDLLAVDDGSRELRELLKLNRPADVGDDS